MGARRRHRPNRRRRERLSALIDSLCARHEKGERAEEIAESEGLSLNHVHNLLRLRRRLSPSLWERFLEGEGTLQDFLRVAAFVSHERQEQELGKVKPAPPPSPSPRIVRELRLSLDAPLREALLRAAEDSGLSLSQYVEAALWGPDGKKPLPRFRMVRMIEEVGDGE